MHFFYLGVNARDTVVADVHLVPNPFERILYDGCCFLVECGSIHWLCIDHLGFDDGIQNGIADTLRKLFISLLGTTFQNALKRARCQFVSDVGVKGLNKNASASLFLAYFENPFACNWFRKDHKYFHGTGLTVPYKIHVFDQNLIIAAFFHYIKFGGKIRTQVKHCQIKTPVFWRNGFLSKQCSMSLNRWRHTPLPVLIGYRLVRFGAQSQRLETVFHFCASSEVLGKNDDLGGIKPFGMLQFSNVLGCINALGDTQQKRLIHHNNALVSEARRHPSFFVFWDDNLVTTSCRAFFLIKKKVSNQTLTNNNACFFTKRILFKPMKYKHILCLKWAR